MGNEGVECPVSGHKGREGGRVEHLLGMCCIRFLTRDFSISARIRQQMAEKVKADEQSLIRSNTSSKRVSAVRGLI